MRLTSLAWVFSGLFLLGCSDDTVAPPKDTGPKKDKGTKIEARVVDLAPGDIGPSIDKPITKTDLLKKVDLPKKVDVKIDGPKTDAKIDGPKADLKKDGPKVDVKKVDGPKGDLPPPPASTKCATPETLSWGTGTTIVKNGNNSNAPNEYTSPSVNCGLGSFYDFDGGQLYYKVTLAANKKYKAILLSPSADLALYAFPAATACTQAGIQAGCTSPTPANPDNVYAADNQGSGGTEVVRVATGATAVDWIFVVDSYYGSASGRGPFTFTLTEFVAPTNKTCATAKVLTLAGTPKKVVETGDTADSTDEFAAVSCGGNPLGPWPGPQLYYKVTLEGGKKYKVTLDAGSVDSALYAFPSATTCSATAINTGCTSPASDPLNIWNSDLGGGSGETVLIAPPASPTTVDWTIVVDSYDLGAKGAFTLTVTEYTPAANALCASPETIALTTSPVTKAGDSSLGPNQFGQSITCTASTTPNYDGNQLYYKVTLTNGKKYTFVLTPTGTWDPAIYAFTDTTCTVATINTQCANNIKDDGFGGEAETLAITPAGATGTTDYIIAIDSYAAAAGGAFSLTISWP